MSAIKNKLLSQEYIYDFAEDGGSQGNITLSSKEGYDALPSDAVIMNVHSWVETACTSAGSATVSWGDGSDVDGYSGSAKAVASLTANAVFEGNADSAALCPSYASNSDFSVTIGTADLTAGKIVFRVSYYVPKRDA